MIELPLSIIVVPAEIAAYGFAFGFANAIQSRLINNGVKRRFPDLFVGVWVMLVSAVFACAARALAQTSGLTVALAYGIGQGIGVVLGTRIANGPLYERLHPDGRATNNASGRR